MVSAPVGPFCLQWTSAGEIAGTIGSLRGGPQKIAQGTKPVLCALRVLSLQSWKSMFLPVTFLLTIAVLWQEMSRFVAVLSPVFFFFRFRGRPLAAIFWRWPRFAFFPFTVTRDKHLRSPRPAGEGQGGRAVGSGEPGTRSNEPQQIAEGTKPVLCSCAFSRGRLPSPAMMLLPFIFLPTIFLSPPTFDPSSFVPHPGLNTEN